MIYLGADHGGFKLKEKVKKWFKEWRYQYEDLGNKNFDKDDDYPEFAIAVAQKVSAGGEESRGILICRSAVGMIIAANKIKGIRAAAVYNEPMAVKSREHNNSNIIALSGNNLSDDEAKKILKTWLETEFSPEERHRRRVRQIEKFENP